MHYGCGEFCPKVSTLVRSDHNIFLPHFMIYVALDLFFPMGMTEKTRLLSRARSVTFRECHLQGIISRWQIILHGHCSGLFRLLALYFFCSLLLFWCSVMLHLFIMNFTVLHGTSTLILIKCLWTSLTLNYEIWILCMLTADHAFSVKKIQLEQLIFICG